MDKLKMHTPNKADENFKKLAVLFPNAVTETIDENGEGYHQHCIPTSMLLMQERKEIKH